MARSLPDGPSDDVAVSQTSVDLPQGGTVRPMTRWGDPVMHRVAQPVTSYDEGLRSLVADMVATMYAADGVGLAACQIGVDLAVFVYDCPDEDGVAHRGIVCNPVLELPEGKDRLLDDGEEGCLSYPGAFVACPRPDFARVTGEGLDGSQVGYEGTGLFARCLQHETDHLFGTVFADRINDRARKKLRKAMENAADEYPLDWPVGVDPQHSGAGQHAD
ncbi:MAG: def 2 [Marmoricola sp.]|nr:def 2 [Marmoricola sp.]